MKKMSSTTSFNWALLLTTLAVGGLGLVNLYSTSQGTSTNLALVQGIWLAVGMLIAIVLTVLDYRIFEKLAYPVLVLTLVLLLAVLFAGAAFLLLVSPAH